MSRLKDCETAIQVNNFRKYMGNSSLGKDLAVHFVQYFSLEINDKMPDWSVENVFNALFEKNVTLASMRQVIEKHSKFNTFGQFLKEKEELVD